MKEEPDGVLGTAVERFTRRIFTEIIAALAQALRAEEFSVAQIALLHLLDREPLLTKDAAKALGLQPPTMSRQVDDLVKRGLMRRTEVAQDRRARLLLLTPAGKRYMDVLSRARVLRVLDVVKDLPEVLTSAVLAGAQAYRISEMTPKHSIRRKRK